MKFFFSLKIAEICMGVQLGTTKPFLIIKRDFLSSNPISEGIKTSERDESLEELGLNVTEAKFDQKLWVQGHFLGHAPSPQKRFKIIPEW